MTKAWSELLGELPKKNRDQAHARSHELASAHSTSTPASNSARAAASASSKAAASAGSKAHSAPQPSPAAAATATATLAPDVFKRDVLTHLDSMYRLAMSLTRNIRDAEDLTQEAALKALGHSEQYRAGTNMRAWLLAIVRNAFINRYRRQRKQPASVEFEDVEPFLADSHTSDDASARVLSVRDVEQLGQMKETLDEEIKRALDDLSEEFRETFLLAVVEGLSYKDIAEILSIPVGTVMSRLFRARRQMQEKLEEYAKQKGWLPIGKAGGKLNPVASAPNADTPAELEGKANADDVDGDDDNAVAVDSAKLAAHLN